MLRVLKFSACALDPAITYPYVKDQRIYYYGVRVMEALHCRRVGSPQWGIESETGLN